MVLEAAGGYVATGTVVAIVTGLVLAGGKVIEGLVARRNGGRSVLTSEEKTVLYGSERKLEALIELLSKTDGTGAPLVYSPRQWGDDLRELGAHMHGVETSIVAQTKVLTEILDELRSD